MAALELFANQAQTTVTSGGATTPASGTSETWTVSSSSGFPAASSTASPSTFFRICDANPSTSAEKIIVTNVSGTTWTVTRGAEGTTSVAHTSGFTIQNVITAAALENLVQLSKAGLLYPSGDTSGATDTAAINAIISAGQTAVLAWTGTNWTGGQTPFYVNAPLTPASGATLRGQTPWSAVPSDNYGVAGGVSGGSVIYAVSGFSGAAAISMANAGGSQSYGVTLEDFTLELGAMPTGHGILVDGAWGACFMSGVSVNQPDGDCLHFQTDVTTSKAPDDWHVFRCKFSGSAAGYGVWGDNVPDSWFTDCEASENHLDNWYLSFSLNTRLTSCKGENSAAGSGFRLGGQGGAGRFVTLTGCSTHLNWKDGFTFDGSGSGSTSGTYLLANCVAIDDNQATGTTFSGFRSAGSVNKVVASNCHASGAAYGASQTGTSAGMTFTGSLLTGATAATHDDGSNASSLVNQAPAGGGLTTVLVLQPSGDTTGVKDAAAINAAVSALPASGGTVTMAAGQWYVECGQVSINRSSVYLDGAGRGATVVNAVGAGDVFRMFDETLFTDAAAGGGIRGVSVYGTSTTGTSTGIHAGDLLQSQWDVEVSFFAFNTSSVGFKFDNVWAITEQAQGIIHARGNHTGVMFAQTPGSGNTTCFGSFERANLKIYIDQQIAAADGVTVANGSYLDNSTMLVSGNFGGTNSGALTSAVIKLTGATPTGSQDGAAGTVPSNLNNLVLNVEAECDTNNGTPWTFNPTTFSIDSGSGCFAGNIQGQLNFGATGNQFASTTGIVNFWGLSYGDPALVAQNSQPWLFQGQLATGTYASGAALASSGTISSATSWAIVSPSAAVTGVIIGAGSLDGQLLTVFNASNFSITIAAYATSHVYTGVPEVIPAWHMRQYWWSISETQWSPVVEGQGTYTATLLTAFTSANSTSPQNVTGLSALLQIGTYKVRGWFPYVGAGTVGDTKTFAMAFGGTAATGTYISWFNHAAAYAAPTMSPTITTSFTTPTITSTVYYMEFTATVVVSAAGALQLTVTNNTAGADEITIEAGAFLEVTQAA